MPVPLLLLDVDGVLAPWGGPDPAGFTAHTFGAERDVMLNAEHAGWLSELDGPFEIVWCTARCEEVLTTVAPALGLPDWPVVTFAADDLPAPRRAGLDGPTWKLPWVDAYAADRPVAWVDDELSDDARRWARERNRTVPTLLIEPDSAVGLTRGHVDKLLAFASRHSR